MWVKFNSDRQFAIKLYIGGINAVSGEPAVENMATKFRRQKLSTQGGLLQDYLVTPAQRWLDGIATGPGVIRQFVATAAGSGYSVEAQITGRDEMAGFQFEVTRRKAVEDKVLFLEHSVSKTALRILVDIEFTSVARLFDLVRSETGILAPRLALRTKYGNKRLYRYDENSLEDLGIEEVRTYILLPRYPQKN